MAPRKQAAKGKGGSTPTLEEFAPEGAWAGAEQVELPLDRLYRDPDNVRGTDLGDVSGLAESIRTVGLLQPLVVAPADTDGPHKGEHRIIAGNRRHAALTLAGAAAAPALIRPDLASATRHLIGALVENLQREGLKPTAEAQGYSALRELGLTQQAIAQATGVDQGTVSKRLSLLKLDDELAAKVDAGTIPVAEAVNLAKIADPEARRNAADGVERYGSSAAGVVQRENRRKALEKARADLERDLEKAKIAVVDWPAYGQYDDREEQPLVIAGQRQNGHGYSQQEERHVKVKSLDEHAGQPCHGAAITDRLDENDRPVVIYVCLDPSRHKLPTLDELAKKRKRAEDRAAKKREAERQERIAAQDARIRVARALTRDKVDRRVMAEHVSTMAALEILWEEAAFAGPEETLRELGVDVPELADADDVQRDLAALIASEGAVRVAFVAAIAFGERNLTDSSRGYWSGARVITGAHLRFLVEHAGYTPTAEEAELLEEPIVPEAEYVPVPRPADAEVPDDAVAWYTGGPVDGDEARYVDEGEAQAIAASGNPHRLEWIPEAATLPESGNQAENAGTENGDQAPDAEPSIDEVLRADADAAHAAAEGPQDLPAVPTRNPDLVDGAPCPGAGQKALDDGRCPACLGPAETTRTGRVKAHKVEPAVAAV